MALTSLPLSLPIGPSPVLFDMGEIDMIINICTDQQQTRLEINRVSQTNFGADTLVRTSITQKFPYHEDWTGRNYTDQCGSFELQGLPLHFLRSQVGRHFSPICHFD